MAVIVLAVVLVTVKMKVNIKARNRLSRNLGNRKWYERLKIAQCQSCLQPGMALHDCYAMIENIKIGENDNFTKINAASWPLVLLYFAGSSRVKALNLAKSNW